MDPKKISLLITEDPDVFNEDDIKDYDASSDESLRAIAEYLREIGYTADPKKRHIALVHSSGPSPANKDYYNGWPSLEVWSNKLYCGIVWMEDPITALVSSTTSLGRSTYQTIEAYNTKIIPKSRISTHARQSQQTRSRAPSRARWVWRLIWKGRLTSSRPIRTPGCLSLFACFTPSLSRNRSSDVIRQTFALFTQHSVEFSAL